jgi:ribosomal protein S18 acetylase RimI-like enzyme
LYRRLGFTEAPLEDGRLARCNIKMELWLNGLLVTAASPENAPVISAIGRQSFSDAFAPFFAHEHELQQYLDHTYDTEKIKASIAKPNNTFAIAWLVDTPVGFVKLKKQSMNRQLTGDRQSELQKIYVLKQYHGKGVADALMGRVLEIASGLQPDWLWLDVIIQNSRAIRFYEKYGFTKAGHHAFVIGSTPFNYHVMALQKPIQ